MVDALQAAGIRAFGPTRAAAQIESSKAFSKAFYAAPRHSHRPLCCLYFLLEAALEYLDQVDFPVVIKTSGLAAGKGVILPESAAEARAALRTMMVEHAFGAAGEAGDHRRTPAG